MCILYIYICALNALKFAGDSGMDLASWNNMKHHVPRCPMCRAHPAFAIKRCSNSAGNQKSLWPDFRLRDKAQRYKTERPHPEVRVHAKDSFWPWNPNQWNDCVSKALPLLDFWRLCKICKRDYFQARVLFTLKVETLAVIKNGHIYIYIII